MPVYDGAAKAVLETTIQPTYTGVPYHTHYMGLSGSALRAAIGLTAGLCFVAFGYGQGDIGGLYIVPSFLKLFPNIFDPWIGGAVTGTWNLGCLTGAFFLIFLSNTLGRKGSVITGLGLEVVGRIIQVSTMHPAQYVAGRFIAGLGNGFIASAVPAWHVECVKTHRRGTMLLVSFGVCITFGMAVALWIDYACSFLQPHTSSWRVPLAIPIILLTPAMGLIYLLPESPRYLILTGRENEALNVLSALNELPPDHEDNRREYLMVKNAVIAIIQNSSLPAIFSNTKFRYAHRVLLAVLLQVMQQFTGVNLFMQYLAIMFRLYLKFPEYIAGVLAASCATAFCVASIFAVLGMDSFWGRRGLTMFGSAGMFVMLVVLAVTSYLDTLTSHHIMAACLFLYCTFFAIGWQGMSWLWAVELIPLSVRGPANALATAANWLANFVVVFFCPAMLKFITWKTYIVFAVLNLVFIPIIYIFYPETGSRSLEEIDMLFQNATEAGKPWFSVVSISKKEPRWYDKDGEPTDSNLSGDDSTMYGGYSEKEYGAKVKSLGSETDSDVTRRNS